MKVGKFLENLGPRKIHTAPSTMPFFEAVDEMEKYNVSTILVVGPENHFMGIFSERDGLRKGVRKLVTLFKEVTDMAFAKDGVLGDAEHYLKAITLGQMMTPADKVISVNTRDQSVGRI
ncbi:CBS domain-containing protein [Patescibacteria group bacterium]|nr:CBS domain-containing protein [Patescibacteria group bacterium]